MSQVVLRSAVAIGGGITLRGLITGWLAYFGAKGVVTVINQQFLITLESLADQLDQIGAYAYYLGCVYILFELRKELLDLARIVCKVITWLLSVQGARQCELTPCVTLGAHSRSRPLGINLSPYSPGGRFLVVGASWRVGRGVLSRCAQQRNPSTGSHHQW